VSIQKELDYVGIASRGAEDEEGFTDGKYMGSSDFEHYQLDPEVKAVVVGYDPKFTYAKLAIAALYLHTGNATFIAANDDAYDMIADRRMPTAGAMLAAIKQSLGSLDLSA
jgi:phosphoglycolate phosphatase